MNVYVYVCVWCGVRIKRGYAGANKKKIMATEPNCQPAVGSVYKYIDINPWQHSKGSIMTT